MVHSTALGHGVAPAPWFAAAAPLNSAVSDGESRAFDALAHAALGAAADGFPAAVEVTRLQKSGTDVGFLVRSPEPIIWNRVDLRLASAPEAAKVDAVMPSALKLTAASFATSVPSEESIGLVARDSLNLEGYAVDLRRVPGPIKGSVEHDLLIDEFSVSGRGLLFTETFGPNALDRYQIVDQGTMAAPSAWSVAGGRIRQSSNIAGGALQAADNAKPGTMAIMGDSDWAAVRIDARLRSTDNDAIGLVFRYVDAQNYYRLSLDKERSYRRLVKCVGGTFTTLWEDVTASYTQSLAFDIRIDAYGSRLTGALNGAALFDVIDDSHQLGRIGLYSWLNVGAEFESLRIEALEAGPVLLRPDLAALASWLPLDPPDAVDGPSAWTPGPDGMTQTSLVHQTGPDQIGTHLVTPEQWTDMQFCVQLQSSADGTVGALLRYLDRNNWYRFTMSRTDGVRRVEKRFRGVQTVLWQAAASFELGRTYSLTLGADGSQLTGSLDGAPLFSLNDADIPHGSVGLTTSKNDGALFSNALVLDPVRTVAGYRVHDAAGLSAWSTAHGDLRQRAFAGASTAPHLGTHAIAAPDFSDVIRLVVEARTYSD
ncbi:MAG: hypothetical protein ABIQ39_03110, partial [Ilumatobacteraceae bacterium]